MFLSEKISLLRNNFTLFNNFYGNVCYNIINDFSVRYCGTALEGLELLDKLIRKILSVFPKFIQELYDKYESAILYLIVGGMTTVVSLITQYIPAFLGLPTEVNTVISWVCAVTFAFFTNKVWVFKNNSNKRSDWIRQAFSFYGARIVTLLLELGFMILTVRVLHQNEYIMKLIAQIFIIILNYFFSKLIVFRKKSDSENKPDDVKKEEENV